MHGERCIVTASELQMLASEFGDYRGRHHHIAHVGEPVLAGLPVARTWGRALNVEVQQWVHKEVKDPFASFSEAMGWLANHRSNGDSNLEFVTRLMIVPGYRVRSAQRLLTNFTCPKAHCCASLRPWLGRFGETPTRMLLTRDTAFSVTETPAYWSVGKDTSTDRRLSKVRRTISCLGADHRCPPSLRWHWTNGPVHRCSKAGCGNKSGH